MLALPEPEKKPLVIVWTPAQGVAFLEMILPRRPMPKVETKGVGNDFYLQHQLGINGPNTLYLKTSLHPGRQLVVTAKEGDEVKGVVLLSYAAEMLTAVETGGFYELEMHMREVGDTYA